MVLRYTAVIGSLPSLCRCANLMDIVPFAGCKQPCDTKASVQSISQHKLSVRARRVRSAASC
eukprot:108723-Alexandrium_andersonii.AAC.1